MTTEQTLAFLAFSLVVAGTPGPSNTLLTAVGANVGVMRGLPALLGVACGMAALMFSVTFGLGALILGTPFLLAAVKLVGAAILLWLAWRIATSSTAAPQSSETPLPRPKAGGASQSTAIPSDGSIADSRQVGRAARPVSFAAAAAFQWVNPKSWLACTSAAAAFQSPGADQAALHAATLAALFAVVALPSCLVWLAFGAIVQHVFRSPRALRTFNLVMAALLVISVALIFLT